MFKSTIVRSLASMLVVTIFFQGCATSGAAMREQARQDYVVPPETTDLMLQTDLDRCAKEATDASSGYMIASGVLSGIGVIVWPMLVVGLGVGFAGAAKEHATKKACMSQAGYIQKDNQVSTAPVAPPVVLPEASK